MGCRCPAEQLPNNDRDLSKSSADQSKCHYPMMVPPDSLSPIKLSSTKPDSMFFTNENTKTSNLTRDFKQYCAEQNPISNVINNNINTLCNALLTEINQMRTSPRAYTTKIAKYIPSIVIRENKQLLNVGNEVYIALNKGKIAFEEAIDFLSHCDPIEPLAMSNELRINIEDENEDITSLRYIQNAFTKKNSNINSSYEIIGFHYDKSVDNAEISAVLQIVDDTGSNYVRRHNLMNEKVKFVGISAMCIKENVYCYYLVFGKRK